MLLFPLLINTFVLAAPPPTTPPVAAPPAAVTLHNTNRFGHPDWRTYCPPKAILSPYAYWRIQDALLDQTARQYPALADRAATQRAALERTFGPGVEEIVRFARAAYSDWDDVVRIVDERAAQEAATLKSEDDAASLLDDIDERLRGNIPSPILETLLAFQPTYLDSPVQELLDGFRTEVSTADNPAARGLRLRMVRPTSWVEIESDNPQVILHLRSHARFGDAFLVVQLRDLSPEAVKEIERDGPASLNDPDLIDSLGGFFTGGHAATLGGRDAHWTQYFMSGDRAPPATRTYTWAFHTLSEGRYLNLQFSVIAAAPDAAGLPTDQAVERRFRHYEPLFRAMAESVTFDAPEP